jgi:hypothetical protein
MKLSNHIVLNVWHKVSENLPLYQSFGDMIDRNFTVLFYENHVPLFMEVRLKDGNINICSGRGQYGWYVKTFWGSSKTIKDNDVVAWRVYSTIF